MEASKIIKEKDIILWQTKKNSKIVMLLLQLNVMHFIENNNVIMEDIIKLHHY